jgi:hypothetical protein
MTKTSFYHTSPKINGPESVVLEKSAWDIAKVDQMNGLRVYINPRVAETCGGFGVFYSRRENGPYYRWAYEEKRKVWRVSRVQPSDFSPKMLSNANWKGVPAALQKSMIEHYQE